VGGLFLADNTGQALLSGWDARLWWSFRNGGSSVAANTNIYGWRNFQDYGIVARSSNNTPTNRYPTFHAFKLMQYFARGGDQVVTALSESSLLAAYAVKRSSGALTLLVINKSPDLTLTGNFNLSGYLADTNATRYTYGIPQDEAVRTGVGETEIEVSSVPVTNTALVSLTFAPYSMTVIELPSAAPQGLAVLHQARLLFTNYARAEVLTNFPVRVVLGGHIPNFSYASFASPTAGDLRFLSADGVLELPYEIERWDPAGDSHVWVQIPRLTHGTSIIAQWGGPDRVEPAYTTNGTVWSNGYVGVWHWPGLLATDAASGATAVTHGAPSVLGRVGVGRTFRRLTSDVIQMPWTSAFNLPSHFEVQGWFKVAPEEKPASGDFLTLSGKQASGDFNNRNWWISLRSDGKLWWRGSPGIDVMSPTDLADGAWHHFSAVHDGSVARLYVDGVQVATDTTPGTASVQNAPVMFGEEYGTGRRMRGLLDEMRLSNVARSSNWVWATYQTIASNSLFTSYGTATTNTPPILAPVANQQVGVGMTLLVTNTATDMDLPAQQLSYSLLTGPAGASINVNSGLINWRPAVSQANSTNLCIVTVVDDGLPSLSSTQNFLVKVNPLNRPAVGSAELSDGLFRLMISGNVGPDYTLQASTNLTSWTSLFTSNSPAVPFYWVDEETGNYRVRFYRVLLGP
jgi:hypothetical protein